MNKKFDMRNHRFKRPELHRRCFLRLKALMLLIVLLIGMQQVQGQEACSLSRVLTPSSSWSMAPSGNFKNGDIVASARAYLQYAVREEQPGVILVEGAGQMVNNPYSAAPLYGMPGLGVRVSWTGFSGLTDPVHLVPPAKAGTIISNIPQRKTLLAAQILPGVYTLTQFYRYELVVIDESIYRGGWLAYTEPNQVQVMTSYQKMMGGAALCINGSVDLMTGLIEFLQLPELPRSNLPGCRFSLGTLQQTVLLGPVDSDQIPHATSPRFSGEVGQAHFSIEGTDCPQGTRLNFYFTDTRDTGTDKNYMLTSNPTVGLRLFHRDEDAPMPFGPLPANSGMLPQRYAPTIGPAMTNAATLSTYFTAQYVRLPSTTEADIKSGPLQAASVLVIVYP
ncbi:fimbrial protein [Alcaligenes sp. Lyrl_28]|uniref:fimbrial protein n=1 Tax=Alcaligenes sp. Lyrl_28 TaxID=3110924 RepID=UPI003F7BAC0D